MQLVPLRRLACLAAAFVIAFACRSVPAQEKITIMTDWSPHGMHAGLLLAAQKGWFKDAGLNVEVLDGKGSGSTIQQVAAGRIDIGFAQLGAMAAAISNGLPVTSVMCFIRAGDNGLVVPASMNVRTLADFRGRKIAVPNGAGSSVFLDAFLKAGGMSRRDFQIVNVDNQAMVSTYSANQVDGALSTVAFMLPLVADVRPATAISFNDVGLRIPGYGLVVTKEAIEKRPDVIAKIVAVNKRVWDYIFGGREEEAVDAMLQQRAALRLDRKMMLGQLKLYMPLFDTPATKDKPRGWQSEDDWRDALRAMEEVGMVKPGWQPAAFFTNRFIPQ